jgi:hypothetical protein
LDARNGRVADEVLSAGGFSGVAARPFGTLWPLMEICAWSLFPELQAGSSEGCELRGSRRVAGKKLWVGFDVGKQLHHACAVEERGKTVFSGKVKNRQAAIEGTGHPHLHGRWRGCGAGR